MVRWRNVIAGVLALLASGQAAAQKPETQPERQNILIVDGRIGRDGITAVRSGLQDAALPNPTLLTQVGRCGEPFQRYDAKTLANIDQASVAGAFDLDIALRSAANLNPSSILLIASGPSECLSISCALAADLANRQSGLKINVIGVSPAAAALNCLALNTGGQFKETLIEKLPTIINVVLVNKTGIVAGKKNEAESAAISASTTTEEGGSPQSDAGEEIVVPRTTPPPKATQADRIEDYPPLPKPRPGQSQAGKPNLSAEPTSTPTAPKPFQWAALPPGAPEQEATLESKGPGVTLRVLAGPEGPLVKTQLAFEILSSEGDGTFRRVAHSSVPNPYFALAKGRYVARVSHGEVVRQFPFTVSSERIDHHAFTLDLGYLSLQARPSNSAAPLESGISYTLFRLKNGTSGNELLERQDSQPMIALPAGRYRVLAQSGAAKIVADIKITAGETLRHHFNFNLGYLRVSVASDALDVALRIERTSARRDGAARVLASHSGSSALFRLPAGQYKAVVLADGSQSHETVTVEQGKLANLVLKLQTAAQEPPQ